MPKPLTNEEFVLKARAIHGNKYDYSKVDYKSCDDKVCIICPEHGEFWQTPYHHLHRKQGCPKCIGRHMSTEEFVAKANKIHHNKYDYTRVILETIKNREQQKITIICPEHGEFKQTPNSHLNGCGCPKCGKLTASKQHAQTLTMSLSEFVKRAREMHGDKYDYSKVTFKTTSDKVCIICPKHGEFWQRASSHINKGNGCPKCHPNHKRTLDEFVERAREVHGDKYDYSKVEYVNNITPVCIICPKHGEFWQRPNSHISRKQGCPECAQSKLEKSLKDILENEHKTIFSQKTFEWTKNGKRVLRYDFYDEGNNVLYECQGIQHIRNCSEAFGDEYFLPLLQRDQEKYKLAKENGVELVYVVEKRYYKEFLRFGGIYTKENLRKIEI